MELYTISTLEADLKTFIRTIGNFNIAYGSLFFTQKKMGARINELCNPAFWNFKDIEKIELQPQKGNKLRYFDMSIFDEYAQIKIKNNEFPFAFCTPEVTRYFFNNYYPRLHVWVERKEIQSHLFRHLYCKKLFEAGQTISQISEKLGERDTKNTQGYIYSQLYHS